MYRLIARHLRKDRKFISVLFFTLLTRGATAFGTLALNLVLARFLGVSGVGLFMLALSIIIGLGVLSRCGMDSALLRFGGIAYGDGNASRFKGLRKQSTSTAGLVSLVLALILGFGREWIADNIFNEPGLSAVLLPMAVLMPAYTFIYLQATWLKALRKPILAPLFETGSVAFMTSVVVLIAALIGQEIDTQWVAWSMFVTTLFVLGVGMLVMHKAIMVHFGEHYVVAPADLEPGLIRKLPDYALMTFTSFSIQWGALLILGLFVSSSQVGLYSTAHRLAFVVNFILMVFNSVVAPQFASLYKSGAHAELEKLVNKSTLYMTIFAIPLLLSFLIVPELWLSMFGEDFIVAAPILAVLAFAQFVNVATGSVGFLLNMTGHQRAMRNIVLFTAATTLALHFTLTPYVGIWGATIATAVSLIMQNLLAAWRVYRVLGILTLPGLRIFVK